MVMCDMNTNIYDDLYRLTRKRDKITLLKAIAKSKSFRLLFFYRKYHNSKSKVLKFLYHIGYHFSYRNAGVELPLNLSLGAACLFLHPYGITINPKAKIGKNLTILKGATIGATNRGKMKGAPIIGDNVYIGLNSTVVGGITIGDDVLIAANTFVNFDVPSHSIVIGSPGVIHSKMNATEGYITNMVDY